MRSSTTAFLIIFLSAGFTPFACNDGPGREPATSSSAASRTQSASGDSAVAESEIDLGEDWDSPDALARTAAPERASIPDGPFWTILLRSETQVGHPQVATQVARSCAGLDARLADAAVYSTKKGSMVIYGRYTGPDDAAAQRDLTWIKAVKLRGQPVFLTAMLTRITPPKQPSALQPHELMSLRARYPNVEPLYTFQIGVWGDFESGRLSLEEIHRRAEAHVRELRAQGYEAYYFHDDGNRLSTVTIGAFDRTAIDPEAELTLDPLLAKLEKIFPANLVNGEPLMEFKSRANPNLGMQEQRSTLVLVPEWPW